MLVGLVVSRIEHSKYGSYRHIETSARCCKEAACRGAEVIRSASDAARQADVILRRAYVVLRQLELTQGGDDSERRWAFIVAEMRKLIGENQLRPHRARFLSVAEQQLAKVKEAQAAP